MSGCDQVKKIYGISAASHVLKEHIRCDMGLLFIIGITLVGKEPRGSIGYIWIQC